MGKRPLSGYFTWLKENRKSIKGKNVAEVSKKAGEMWKSLSAEKKKAFEDRASKAKTEYAAYIAKVKDTDAFQAYKGELAVARKKRLKRSVKSAMRKVKMDASYGSRTPARALKERTLLKLGKKREKCGRVCQLTRRRPMGTVRWKLRKNILLM